MLTLEQAHGELTAGAAERERLSRELAAREAEFAAQRRPSAVMPAPLDDEWLVSANFGDT